MAANGYPFEASPTLWTFNQRVGKLVATERTLLVHFMPFGLNRNRLRTMANPSDLSNQKKSDWPHQRQQPHESRATKQHQTSEHDEQGLIGNACESSWCHVGCWNDSGERARQSREFIERGFRTRLRCRPSIFLACMPMMGSPYQGLKI